MMDKFAQSLFMENDEVEKNIYFDFHNKETSCMYKKAYVTSMKNPTGEKIKEHILNRVKSDFGLDSNNVKVAVNAEKTDGENITQGNGTAIIQLKDKKINIPFQIVNGEISDFSEIKVGNDSIAYSKQSISKILEQSKRTQSTGAFIGTTRADNESTDRGFLEDVIKIRDNHVSKQTNTSAGRYITASEACDEMLKKTASIKKIDETNYAAVEAMVREKIASTVSEKLEKIASVDIDKQVSHAQEVFAKMENLPLKSVHTMKHGQKILFPEVRGNEISMTPGVVFKKIDKGYYKASRYNEVSSTYVTIVMSYDGRIALLGSGQTMLALEDNSIKFKLPSTRLKAVQPRQNYIAINGDHIIAPFYIENRMEGCHEPLQIVKELSEILGVHDPIISMKPAFVESDGWLPSIDIVLMNGEPFRTHLKSVKVGGNTRYINGITEKLKKHLVHKPNLLASVSTLISLDSSIAADPETKVAKINGVITGYISNKNELNPNINRAADHLKLANYDMLKIEKTAKDKDEYSVKVNGKNRKDFGNKLSKKETQTIMLSMGYKPDEIGEAMHHVNSKGRYNKQLPNSTKINKLYDGEVESRTKKIMNSVKDAAFDKNKAKDALKDFYIGTTAGTLGEMASENDTIYAALEYLSKFAEESSAAAITFEKLAMEYKSEELQNVAKTMICANNLFKSIKEAYEGKEIAMFKEACTSVVSNKDTLEELTTGMAQLSKDQFAQSDEYVPYEAIRTATEVIGGMYELAKHASISNQDLICIKCNKKAEAPLQNGKCEQCSQEELDRLNEEEKRDKTTDDKEIDGNVGDEDK